MLDSIQQIVVVPAHPGDRCGGAVESGDDAGTHFLLPGQFVLIDQDQRLALLGSDHSEVTVRLAILVDGCDDTAQGSHVGGHAPSLGEYLLGGLRLGIPQRRQRLVGRHPCDQGLTALPPPLHSLDNTPDPNAEPGTAAKATIFVRFKVDLPAILFGRRKR